MDAIVEPTNIGLGETNHQWLTRFKEDQIFSEMADAYRFAVAYALSKEINPPEIADKRRTIFGVATIDPNKEIYTVVTCLMPNLNGSVYQMVERLADWGISDMAKLYSQGKLDIASLVTVS